jgi:hypothetical protein
MPNQLEKILAGLLKPSGGANNNEQVEALNMIADGINLTDALTVATSASESRVGYALIGYSEVG